MSKAKKYNDDLLKSKLSSHLEEPRSLTFEQVEAGYQNKTKFSLTESSLFKNFVFGSSALILSLVYLLMTYFPEKDHALVDKNVKNVDLKVIPKSGSYRNTQVGTFFFEQKSPNKKRQGNSTYNYSSFEGEKMTEYPNEQHASLPYLKGKESESRDVKIAVYSENAAEEGALNKTASLSALEHAGTNSFEEITHEDRIRITKEMQTVTELADLMEEQGVFSLRSIKNTKIPELTRELPEPEIRSINDILLVNPHKNMSISISSELVINKILCNTFSNQNASSVYKAEGLAGDFSGDLSKSYKNETFRFYSGSVFLELRYRKCYFKVGFGSLNSESQINTSRLGFVKRTIEIDTIIRNPNGYNDTITKVVYTRNPIRINGDTLNSGLYLNSLRYITFPLQVKYPFNIYRNRLFLDPYVGLQIAIPLNSQQLVATNAYEFEYKKTKSYLRPFSVFYDLALSLRYRISPSATIYVKQGYFFNNKSVYVKDYLINYTIKNLYSIIGISILVK